jgi:hypothetical protein
VSHILQAPQEKLLMTTLLYNPCLLIIINKEAFGIVGIQTNNTLFLTFNEFAALKDSELQKT